MRHSGPVQVLVATVLWFGPLTSFAQHYYGRDHHVYHPPAQAKPAAKSAHARTRATSTTAANNTVHGAGATAATTSSKPDVVAPHSGERQPQ